ncbi:hypothetical protein EL84_25860 [Paenibacillus sp. VT-400]|uniref:hypothetical protein n=1 Tax=Paenibacillus sp. VT-400 TaxID=1495853 RepID=UPI00064A39AF|nr:hypothetical protein [Paenibacillus sp. VT-400]KLU55471.1 hypothetical protein EL84_25860 [Paenibacillus sp. VT-400]
MSSKDDDYGWDDILDSLSADSSDSNDIVSFGTEVMLESIQIRTVDIEKGFGQTFENSSKQDQNGKDKKE